MDWRTIAIYTLFFVGLYYLLILMPRRSQDRKHKQMLSDLKIGSRIVTIGGLYGKVAGIQPDTFLLEIADGVVIEVAGRSISYRLLDEDENVEPIESKATQDEKA